jgi:hypothetical protein
MDDASPNQPQDPDDTDRHDSPRLQVGRAGLEFKEGCLSLAQIGTSVHVLAGKLELDSLPRRLAVLKAIASELTIALGNLYTVQRGLLDIRSLVHDHTMAISIETRKPGA